MATTPISQSLQRGGAFLIATCTPDDIFSPAELTDDQRLIGQTAEEFVTKEVLPNIPELERTKTASWRGCSRRRAKSGLLGGACRRSTAARGSIGSPPRCFPKSSPTRRSASARRPLGHRHAAHRLFRHRRAKEKISAASSPPANSWPPIASRSRRPVPTRSRPHARRALSRREELDPQRPEDVDHQRRLRRRLHRLRQSGRREILLLHRGARVPGLYARRRREKDGFARQLHHADLFRELPRCPKENLLHEIGRGHIVAFNILNVGRFTLGAYCLGGSKKVLEALRAIRQGAHRVRPAHRRIRPDPRQAWRNGHPHLRRSSPSSIAPRA